MSQVCLPSRAFNDRRIRGCHLRVMAAIAILGAGGLTHQAIGAECGIADRDLRRELRALVDYGYINVTLDDGKINSYEINYLEGGDKTSPGDEITPGDENLHTPGVPPPLVPPSPPGPPQPPYNPPTSPAVKSARATRLPDDWMPSEAGIAYAAQYGITGGWLARVIEDYRDYWHARAGPGALKLDWGKTWQTWVRREADRKAQSNGRQGRKSATDNLIEGFGRAAGLGNGPADSGPDWSSSGPLLDGEYAGFDA